MVERGRCGLKINLDADQTVGLELPVDDVVVVANRCSHTNHQRHLWPHFSDLSRIQFLNLGDKLTVDHQRIQCNTEIIGGTLYK